MHKRTNSNPTSFKITAITENTEVWTLVDGIEYVYSIDGALLEEFRTIYTFSPLKALNFLKKHSLLL